MINTTDLATTESVNVETHGDQTVMVLEYGWGRETRVLTVLIPDEHLEHIQARAQEILAGRRDIQIVPARIVPATERERVAILATGQAVIGEPKRFGDYSQDRDLVDKMLP